MICIKNYPIAINAIVALGLMCLLSPLTISFGGLIPITLQSLLILLTGIILGPKFGALVIFAYLGLGAIGLPVFSGGSSGIEKLWGPSAGFLLSFPFAAGLAGKLGAINKTWKSNLAALGGGHILILSLGFAWLGYHSGYNKLAQNIIPLIPGLLTKITLGLIIIAVLKQFTKGK
ncbi:MAG: biotin transporter BioY [Pseudomonadales bacterium]|nr:biotin transporter BioY [Pseudomonadales bacterium]